MTATFPENKPAVTECEWARERLTQIYVPRQRESRSWERELEKPSRVVVRAKPRVPAMMTGRLPMLSARPINACLCGKERGIIPEILAQW